MTYKPTQQEKETGRPEIPCINYRKHNRVETPYADKASILKRINTIRQSIRELGNEVDYLFGYTLYDEVRDYIVTAKTITTEKLQDKFSIGYVKACYLIDMLLKDGYISKDEQSDDVVYTVIKHAQN